MARATYIEIPEAQVDKYWGQLRAGDRFVFPRVIRKNVFFGRKKIKGLTRRSYLPAVAKVWAGFTDQQKADWKALDSHPRKHGWRSFVADQCKRIKFGLPGTATPNEYHQDVVGAIDIQEPAEEVKLAQFHPSQYWVKVKISGKKAMYEPVSVTEALALPLKISINYKSDLVSTVEIIDWGYGEKIYGEAVYGDDGISGPFVKFYAEVRHFYQGRNIDTKLEIDIPLVSNWTKQDIILDSVLGEVSSYNLYIYLLKVRGTFLFDNPKAEHSAQNWGRDTYCKNVAQSFTRAFYQVPKNWAAICLPAGADFDSYYPS